MKKKLAIVLAVVMAVTCLGCIGASAADTDAEGPRVRVNSALVDFPDGQPYFDEAGRTMIPVRFVAEEMDADVTWNGKTMTATIEKDGITVEITVGNKDLKVTSNGSAATVPMDTAAVAKGGRIYVPIRFIAESLGDYVDYSSKYKMVSIYDSSLSNEELQELHSLSFTLTEYGSLLTYEAAAENHDSSYMSFYYGDRAGITSFADAREFLYENATAGLTCRYPALGCTVRPESTSEYLELIVSEATLEVEAKASGNLGITFMTDDSCIYQPDAMTGETAVRGYCVINVNADANNLTHEELVFLDRIGVNDGIVKGAKITVPLDCHMQAELYSSEWIMHCIEFVPCSANASN